MVILADQYSDEKNIDGDYLYPDHIIELNKYVQSVDSNIKNYTGKLNVLNGKLTENNVNNARSIAEDITISGGSPYYRATLEGVKFDNLSSINS